METFRRGDRVKIVSGKDEGETATVIQVDGQEPAVRVVYDEPKERWMYTGQLSHIEKDPSESVKVGVSSTIDNHIREKAANFIQIVLATAGESHRPAGITTESEPAPYVRKVSLLIEENAFNELNEIVNSLRLEGNDLGQVISGLRSGGD